MKEKGIGQGMGGRAVGEKTGELLVTAKTSVAAADTHRGIQYLSLN